jgi:hypothetical protein
VNRLGREKDIHFVPISDVWVPWPQLKEILASR